MRGLQLFGGEYTDEDQEPLLVRNDCMTQGQTGTQLLDLKVEILERILENLDLHTHLSLLQVNKRLCRLIGEKFLFKHVVLVDKLSLLKFNALLQCKSLVIGKDVSSLVKTVEFVNPEHHDSLFKYSKYYKGGYTETVIGGSYSFVDNGVLNKDKRRGSVSRPRSTSKSKKKYHSLGSETHSSLFKLECKFSDYTYIELMLNIIDLLPHISHVILSSVESNFKIPLWYSVFNDGSKDFFKKIIQNQQSMNVEDIRSFRVSEKWISQYKETFLSLRRFKKLSIKAQDNILLKPNLLCCFGVFDELVLENVTITTESLDTPLEYLPLQMRVGSDNLLDLHCAVQSLELRACTIKPGNGLMRLLHAFFFLVRKLSMFDLQSKFDLLLINCFSSLTHLTLDCNSSCFVDVQPVSDTYYYPADSSQQDTDDAKTLIDVREEQKLTAPPPTTPVVALMNYEKLINDRPNISRRLALLTADQAHYFNSSSISAFHCFFHHFKPLWERIPRKNIHLTIVNIPFTNVFPLDPQYVWERFLNTEVDTLYEVDNVDDSSTTQFQYWWDSKINDYLKATCTKFPHLNPDDQDLTSSKWNDFHRINSFKDIPNVNLWFFFKLLSRFQSVEIRMLRQWLFCTPRSRYDWELLLNPILNARTTVKVKDNAGYLLYSYGSTRN